MDYKLLGVCPTCYLTVSDQDHYVLFEQSDETIAYHKDCEPSRLKFVRKNEDKWMKEGMYFKSVRENLRFSVAETAEFLHVSETKLRKFEAGKPVTHAGLLKTALLLFFEREGNRMENAIKKPTN